MSEPVAAEYRLVAQLVAGYERLLAVVQSQERLAGGAEDVGRADGEPPVTAPAAAAARPIDADGAESPGDVAGLLGDQVLGDC